MSHRKLQLSEQQQMIATLAAAGMTNKEIAAKLGVGPRAIETQFRRMRDKFGTSNKTGTIARIRELLQTRENDELKSLANLTVHMPALLVAFDKKYAVVAANGEAERLLAPARHDSEAGRTLWKRITPGVAHRQRLPALSQETIQDYVGHITQMPTQNGRPRWICWSSQAHSRPIAGWSCWAMGWDVTEIYAHSALLDLLRMAGDDSKLGIWILDENMHTLYVNKALQVMLETTDTVLRNSTPLNYVRKELQKSTGAFLRGGGGEIEMDLQTACGNSILVRKRVSWRRTADGRPRGLVVVVERLDGR